MPATKAEVRKGALQRRDGLDLEIRAEFASRLAIVGPTLVTSFGPSDATRVTTLFSSIGSEPDTRPLAEALRAMNVPLALPVDWSHGTSLIFRQWTPGDRLTIGPLGIAEPMPNAPELDPDVMFIPVIAFDRRGHRIGYGAGNVDQTLRGLRKRKAVRVVGVAYATQEQDLVPSDVHDEPVDLVITDREIITCRS